MAWLCLLKDDGSIAERWQLGERPVTVGRGDTAEVRIDDDGLSRRHFVVMREGDDFLLKDLSSRNGTWLEGERVLTRGLQHNECFQAGRSRFLFAERMENLAVLPIFKPPTGPHDTVIIPTVGDRAVADISDW